MHSSTPTSSPASTATLRAARESDLPALLALEAQFPGDRMSARQFRRHLASPRAMFRVVEAGGHVVGYHLVLRRLLSRWAWLYSIAVAHHLRGQGLGRRLLDDAEGLARADGRRGLRLEVRADNAAAISLYERAGYVRIARLRRYYDDGRDGWRYALEWS